MDERSRSPLIRRPTMTTGRLVLATILVAAPPAIAQDAGASDSRTAMLEQAQAEKASRLHPYVPNKAEKYLNYVQTQLTSGLKVHPFFENAYAGGGFTVGAGYMSRVGSYNTLDVRGSITPSGYKRIESEFIAPRLFHRQGVLSLLGGWREATQVGFYGLGTANAESDKATYGFKQPYGMVTLSMRPANRLLVLRGGFEASQWEQTPGSGSAPSVETIYTPETLSGLGSTITYLHTHGVVGVDSRPSAGYARRGGFYGVTVHDYTDTGGLFGFTRGDYEAIQHIPLLRDAWVLSFHGRVSTTATKRDEEIPFFMLPALGGGSSLRGFANWRFRDRNSLELQAEWRVIVNRFVDVALFYDAGKVIAHSRDLDLSGLKSDGGIGVRFHGPLNTPLRIELATGNEGPAFVFAASAAF